MSRGRGGRNRLRRGTEGGVLIHHYRMDASGNVTYSNIITPTALNHAMIEASLLTEARGGLYGETDEGGEMVKRLEETVRAFDPCISCSVHLVNL